MKVSVIAARADLSFVGVLALVAAVLAFFVGVLALGIWLVFRRHAKQGRRWAEAAHALGLQRMPATRIVSSSVVGGPSTAQPMRGLVGGRGATVSIRRERFTSRTTGSWRNVHHTCCNLELRNRSRVQLRIRPREIHDPFLDAWRPFATGHEPFDRIYRVEAPMPELVIAVLAARGSDGLTLADQFVRHAASGWSFFASETEVFAERRGIVVDANEIGRALALLSDLADRFEGGGDHRSDANRGRPS